MASRKTEWGKRNAKLSSELLEGGIYLDWSVTTAFYSAVQYVEDVIFPIKINGVVCNQIGEARSQCGIDGRHATREKLVYSSMGPQVGAYYKWLDDRSRTARYKTYKIEKNEAVKAHEYLLKIVDACTEESKRLKNDKGDIKNITIR